MAYTELRKHFPDRVPVIVETARACTLPPLADKKYLVPKTLPVSQFQYILRQKLKLDASEALFLFINDGAQGAVLPRSHDTVGALAETHATPTRALHMTMSTENTFGHRGVPLN